MKINVARDIVPIGEFKTHASEMLRTLEQTGRPLVITQHGKPQAVVITPEEFEELAYRRDVRNKVEAGIRSAQLGKAWLLAAARDHLKKRIRASATR
jgi:prevent-host-death family protein